MGIGSWSRNNRRDIDLDWVEKIKLFRIEYKNQKVQKDRGQWDRIIKEIEKMLEWIGYQDTTIFGRARIINTLIEPKLIYLAHSLDPPKQIKKKHNNSQKIHFQKYHNSDTTADTSPTDKRGGINLHDLETKIEAIRLKRLRTFLDDPHSKFLTYYFIAGHLKEHIKYDNTKIHYGDKLPTIYENMKTLAIKNKLLLDIVKPHEYYIHLVRHQMPPLKLNERIKRLDINVDQKPILSDLHNNRHFNNNQKNIFYRLIFGITPTSEGKARKLGVVQPCKLCGLSQETEEHMFYGCITLTKTKQDLLKLLRIPTDQHREMYGLIFLGLTSPNLDRDIKHYRQTIAQIYRDTVWGARLDATFNRRIITDEALSNTFVAKAQINVQTHVVELQTLEKLDKLLNSPNKFAWCVNLFSSFFR